MTVPVVKHLEILERLSLSQQSRESYAKNKKMVSNLNLLHQKSPEFGKLKSDSKIDKNKSNLLIFLSSKIFEDDTQVERSVELCELIFTKKITKTAQIEAAFNYYEQNKTVFNKKEFEIFCGIGITTSNDEIEHTIDKVIAEYISVLSEQKREAFKKLRPAIMKKLGQALPWADGKARTEIFNRKISLILGPDNEQNDSKNKLKTNSKKDPHNNSKTSAVQRSNNSSAVKPIEELDGAVSLKKYLSGRKLSSACNSREEYEAHLRRTNNVFRTRFPPEPNGFLHIGHAKAMNFNFSLAKEKGGECYLRFDDTNPLAEEMVYINSIVDNVKWLGHCPTKTTYSSDYFDDLYDLAVKMIKKGFAYVCHETKEQIKTSRDHRIKTGEAIPSPYRDRSVEENLELFERMRNGKYKAGEATLRMKGNLLHPNPNMWDPIAYRIIFASHPHVGDKWCVYPSYDFTHCIVDSLEDIDASCCTLEFETRRESYFWLLDVLELYKPVVWEFSRLNVDYNVMSKRRLLFLVDNNHVDGWDDPRLLTLVGLRRRGVPAEAINNFCDKIGVTRAENSISQTFFNSCVREVLDKSAVRAMCVMNPLKVVLSNFDENRETKIKCPNFPTLKEESGYHFEKLKKVVYIEREDFRLNDSKKFYGLAPGKTVRLKYAFNIKCEQVVYGENKEIKHLLCSIDYDNKEKLKKGILHWAPENDQSVCDVEIRLYERLFRSAKPGAESGDWISDINKESKKIIKHAVLSNFVIERCASWEKDPWECSFQFERVGFFCKDESSSDSLLVLNRILPLKESKDKIDIKQK